MHSIIYTRYESGIKAGALHIKLQPCSAAHVKKHASGLMRYGFTAIAIDNGMKHYKKGRYRQYSIL